MYFIFKFAIPIINKANENKAKVNEREQKKAAELDQIDNATGEAQSSTAQSTQSPQ